MASFFVLWMLFSWISPWEVFKVSAAVLHLALSVMRLIRVLIFSVEQTLRYHKEPLVKLLPSQGLNGVIKVKAIT